ncbi:hypothetical protein [Leptolyngbya sp. Cla-17]|uniref:hypothetical protein n=1 Tax=Leptolyngbya sp. Cla-17 TaxID=2803751 RepID=UPI0018D7299E|nr:hypothetical protein [Leptolyngbya sp. Cla-17]
MLRYPELLEKCPVIAIALEGKMPKFQTMQIWQQAELLMQPAFIRLIANLGKQLEDSDWRGDYKDVQVWAEGTSESTKALVMQLRSQLEGATEVQTEAIEQQLSQLPTPFPGYWLYLSRGDHQITVDLWDLCYQICFQNYDSIHGTSHAEDEPIGESVAIEVSLFDETGEVDWHRLDDKACQIVKQVFAGLPT